MKFNKAVSSAPGKSRKAHFNASSAERRVIMSSPLSKTLREKYNVRSMPIRKGDTVKVVRGGDSVKGKEAKVISVYRKKYIIHIDTVTRDNAKATAVQIPIHPSNVVMTGLYMNGDRTNLIARKAAGKKVKA
eukprot:UN00384